MDGLEQADGFWYRPWTRDLRNINETRQLFNRPVAPVAGDVLLDIGAHIGTVTRYALDAGAAKVKAVEPAPDNVHLFRMNVDDPRCELVEAAACGSVIGEETFYLNPGKGSDSHTLVAVRRYTPIQVKTLSLADLCEGFDPTYVKVDIEGGEYQLDLIESFPDSADRLFIEFHFRRKGDREKGLEIKRKLLGELGFELVRGFNWTAGAWGVDEVYRR